MKTTEENNVLITIKGKDFVFTGRVPLWKAHFIVGELEKHEADKRALLAKQVRK